MAEWQKCAAHLKLSVRTFFRLRQLSTFGDLDHFLRTVSRTFGHMLNLLNHLEAFKHFSKDNMLPIQPATDDNQSLSNIQGNRGLTDLVTTVVMKNWEPLVSLPEFAMLNRPGLLCFNLKFSSANLGP